MQTLVVESAIASLLPDLDHPPFNTCGLSRALGTRTRKSGIRATETVGSWNTRNLILNLSQLTASYQSHNHQPSLKIWWIVK